METNTTPDTGIEELAEKPVIPATEKPRTVQTDGLMQTVKTAARIISAIFSPLLAPTYGAALALWVTFLYAVPLSSRINVLVVTFAITTMIPVIGIYVMLRLGLVTDSGLNKQKERLWPYVLTLLCYIATAIYYSSVKAPGWMCGYLIGGAAAALLSMLINFKWKISGHGAAMGGIVALAFFIDYYGLAAWNATPWFIASILCAGLVGTSRLILDRHTLMQVAAGIANGFACVYICLLLSI
ncbi:MAG: phosphatase PAP2 family protein [Muribaculaceae bacterium]|nr:phosphatase PAP2 family protein [Muribaculaceae bacterium]